MKVYERNLAGASAAETGRAAETHETGRPSNDSVQDPRGDGDRVELSGVLGRVSRALAAYGADRSAAVQSLAARYRGGRYQADAMTVGRALIAETLASETH